MRMYDLIEKKKRGGALSREEIRFMIQGYVSGAIPDYQMSAMLMAIYFSGMDDEETTALTLEMAHSGDMVDLSPIRLWRRLACGWPRCPAAAWGIRAGRSINWSLYPGFRPRSRGRSFLIS